MITRKVFKYSIISSLVAMTLGTTPLFAEVGSSPENSHQFSLSGEYFVYVGSRTTKQRNATGKGVEVFSFNSNTGEMVHIQSIEGVVNPSYLVMDKTYRHLYAVQGDTALVSVFNVNSVSGQLTFIDSEYTGGINPVHLTLSNDGHFLVIANYASGSLSSLPVLNDGTLDPLVDLVVLKGEAGPHRIQQSSSHPHQVQLDPSGKWIVSPDKGLDKVFVHSLSKEGMFIPNDLAANHTRNGAGPRHIAFHPNGKFGYIANELNSTIGAYLFDASEGVLTPFQILSTLPNNYTGDNTASGIFTSRDGRFVYVSNRGNDSIAIYEINAKSGELTPVDIVKTGGKQPRFFTFDITGKWLFAANEKSNTLSKFEVNRKTGTLKLTDDVIETGSPVAMIFSPKKNTNITE